MKLKWKLRFQNKATLSALIAAAVTFVYQIMGIFGIVPGISEKEVIEWFGIILNLLVVLGIITDPSTAGIGDTKKVMEYTEPRKETEE